MDRIETIDESGGDELLGQVLATPGSGRPASADSVRSFLKYVAACRLGWAGYRLRRDQQTVAMLYVLFLPGNTAIVMTPAPAACDADASGLRSLLASVLTTLADRNLRYIQALTEPEAGGKRDALLACGFRRLTRLVYLQRNIASPPPSSSFLGDVEWLPYDANRHDAFARVLSATYEDSLDCPELTPLRSIEDVIAAHKGSGEFDPTLWEIASVDGRHAGCILVSRLGGGSLAEIVYMGVAPAWRRRGVGALLLRRAIEQCDAIKASGLSVAVDERNRPARQLYTHCGFRPFDERDAFIWTRES